MTVFLVATMAIVILVMENLYVIAIQVTLEQTVPSEMFVFRMNANIIPHVLFIDQIISVNVQMVILENFVSKLTIASAARVKMLESVSAMRLVSYADV